MTAVPENLPIALKAPNFFQKNKLWFIVIALFSLSNLGVYMYQRHQHSKLLEESRVLLDKEYKAAEAMSLQRSEEIATNLCRTLVFGIRGEMEHGDKDDIEVFVNALVQETGVDLIAIQDGHDSIYLSTDKKFENQKSRFGQGLIEENTILTSSLEEVVVAAPIRGVEHRLGTCLLVYKAPKAADDMLAQMRQDSMSCERRKPLK